MKNFKTLFAILLLTTIYSCPEKNTKLEEWDPNETFYAKHVDNDCELTPNCARVKIDPDNYTSYSDNCDVYDSVKIIDLDKWDLSFEKNCGHEQDISKYERR